MYSIWSWDILFDQCQGQLPAINTVLTLHRRVLAGFFHWRSPMILAKLPRNEKQPN
jgi:hypothetical protein